MDVLVVEKHEGSQILVEELEDEGNAVGEHEILRETLSLRAHTSHEQWVSTEEMCVEEKRSQEWHTR